MAPARAICLALALAALAAPAARALQAPAAPRAMRAGGAARRYTLAAEADRVEGLPGAPGPQDFGMFAGNVTVSEAAGRALFYVFVERADDPEDVPVILWLNGGPGCSSLGGGFMSELGPYFPHQGGDALKTNPYAWNNGLANVIFLESPAFVGFSYSSTPSDAIVGDARTAADARKFLLGWLQRFPQYADSDIFLAGESYGGHYVPNLALEIVRGNRRADEAAAAAADSAGTAGAARGRINLRGFLVGNAWTDPAIDNEGTLDFWYSHALVSDEARDGIKAHCNFSTIGPLMRGRAALALGRAAGLRPGRVGAAALAEAPGGGAARVAALEALQALADEKCEDFVELAFSEISGINIYEIYADTCHPDDPPEEPVASSSSSSSPSSPAAAAAGRYRGALLGADPPPRRAAGRATGRTAGRTAAYPHPGRVPRYDPCIDNKVDVYMNKPEVQAALHANQTGDLPGPWADCTQAIEYSRRDLLSSMVPVYRDLLAHGGLQMWVFSGDVDGIVPVLGSRRWIRSLGLPTTSPWRAWQSQTGQIAGWRVDYEGLTFVTVRNAGHMVPYVQPERAYHLVADFLREARPAPTAR